MMSRVIIARGANVGAGEVDAELWELSEETAGGERTGGGEDGERTNEFAGGAIEATGDDEITVVVANVFQGSGQSLGTSGVLGIEESGGGVGADDKGDARDGASLIDEKGALREKTDRAWT